LVQFAKSELVSAELVHSAISDSTYYRIDRTEIRFEFNSLKYKKMCSIRLEQNWDVLTKGQTENPPQLTPFMLDSRVEAWTNNKGTGVYQEVQEKELDNWLVFKDLKSVLIAYSNESFSPAINGFFMDDEIKWAKKMAKAKDGRSSRIWNQLSFDSKGNVIGLNQEYLKSKINATSEAQLIIKNALNEVVYIESVEASIPVVVNGVKISKENSELVVFSEELNFMLHKFAADFFPDPAKQKMTYLWAMHEKSKKGLERFEEIAENE